MEKKKLKMFVFQVEHTIDLITNSSSELFVLRGKSKQHVMELIQSIYPNYLNEYHEVKCIDELSCEEIETYIYQQYDDYWSEGKSGKKIIPGFTFDEMYEPSSYKQGSYHSRPVTDEMKDRYVVGISPKKDLFFIFSKNENPIWEEQEKLMTVATRYHLG
jgi:hypothetical protein